MGGINYDVLMGSLRKSLTPKEDMQLKHIRGKENFVRAMVRERTIQLRTPPTIEKINWMLREASKDPVHSLIVVSDLGSKEKLHDQLVAMGFEEDVHPTIFEVEARRIAAGDYSSFPIPEAGTEIKRLFIRNVLYSSDEIRIVRVLTHLREFINLDTEVFNVY